jgi:aryl-alcohol dehydrogenase-like predicted oxidoreductase
MSSHQKLHERYGDRLPRRRLGRSELIVPALSLGGAQLGSAEIGDDEAIETVQVALAQGIDYFDTSPMYGGGESERRYGRALEGVPRDSFTLSTKTGSHPERWGDYTWDGTMWTVENSLRVLKTDYLDLVLVHDPDRLNPEGIRPVFAPHGALSALENLKEQGIVRAIGLGQMRFDYHRQAIESGRFDVILTYNNYQPVDTSAADWLLPLAQEYDVGVINGSPMAHGLLIGEDPEAVFARRENWPDDVPPMLPAARRFYHWCQERRVPMVDVIFQFCLRQPLIHCTLTGAKTRAELERNLKAATAPLPIDVWDELAELKGAESDQNR